MLVFALFALTIAGSQDRFLFEDFKSTYNRRYNSAEEENMRFSIFLGNLEKNRQHNAGDSSFKLAVNQFSDLTNAEYRELALRPLEAPETSGEVYTSHVGATFDVDWRDHGAVTPVKNQEQCGSCWAFSTTGSLESLAKVNSGKLVSLSEQELVDCDSTDGGCNGGLPSNAFTWISNNAGLCSESDYPYEGTDDTCRKSNCDSVSTCTGFTAVSQGDETALASACANNGAISVGIDASHYSFQSYGGGVYDEPNCSSSQLDHGVLVAGYGSDSGKDFWLVKNSWGTGWGLGGYIWMSRNADNQCGIASMATYPTGAKVL